MTTGFDARGKRIVRQRSAKTKTAGKDLLKEMLRDLDDGLTIAPSDYTVGEAVRYWLEFGLSGRSPRTAENFRFLAEGHIVPALGRRQLRDLSVDDVDRRLAKEAKQVNSHADGSRCRCAAWRRSEVIASYRQPTGARRARGGGITAWCSPPRSGQS
ncbi:hypothetical protein ACTXG6_06090 [Pseudonocardia sp. Cha107L01]|uniref:hypothetical protein n=1 Tax=Pseudonocardia sp. Cha107L01 TaxID=3457576 RepID=UPI00403E4D52